jgi:RNA 2',3'-cyclic 3'-phosphodiesterase
MPRLFIAIELPQAIRERLAGLKTDIPTARWVRPEQMHLTLRFIGADVPSAQVEPISAALSLIQSSPFQISIEQVGSFPANKRRPPTVLWVGVRKQPLLKALYSQLESALVGLGFPTEERDFSPHITLARLKLYKSEAAVSEFLRQNADFRAGTFIAERFALFSSTLTPDGPNYEQILEFALERS